MAIDLSRSAGAGSTSGGDFPWPARPGGAGFIPMSYSVRIGMISDQTTDFIYFPREFDTDNSSDQGYYRFSKFRETPANEWAINWTAIAAFTGATLTTLDDAEINDAQIKNGKIYIRFNDTFNALGNGSGKYHMVKADATTGTIEWVREINTDSVTIINASGFGIYSRFNFFEVKNNGNIRFWIAANVNIVSPNAQKGFAYVEFASDLVTVVDEGELGGILSNNPNGGTYIDSTDITNRRIMYVTEDESIIMLGAVGGDAILFVVGYGFISIPPLDPNAQYDNFVTLMSQAQITSTLTYTNFVSEDFVSIGTQLRINPTTNYALPRFHRRSDVDQFYRDIVYNMTGVIV